MIAAILLAAGTCLVPPFYPSDFTGPVCTTANQDVECQCSECMAWDPVVGADWYDVNRVDQDGTIHTVIGSSKIIYAYTDDDGTYHPKVVLPWYCFAMDASTPNDGRRYLYRVRACSAAKSVPCGDWSTQAISYIGAPITCYEDGKKIACPQIN